MASPRKFEIMSIKARFGINKELAHTKGAECVIDEMTFFVGYRSPSNRVWAKLYEEGWKAHREDLESLSSDQTLAINQDIFARALMLGWKNVKESINDSELVTFSVDEAIRLFSEYPELYYDLSQFAVDRANFLSGDAKVDAKN